MVLTAWPHVPGRKWVPCGLCKCARVSFCMCVWETPRRERCMGVPRPRIILSRCFPLPMFLLIHCYVNNEETTFPIQLSVHLSIRPLANTKQSIAPFSELIDISDRRPVQGNGVLSEFFSHPLFLLAACTLVKDIVLFHLKYKPFPAIGLVLKCTQWLVNHA